MSDAITTNTMKSGSSSRTFASCRSESKPPCAHEITHLTIKHRLGSFYDLRSNGFYVQLVTHFIVHSVQNPRWSRVSAIGRLLLIVLDG